MIATKQVVNDGDALDDNGSVLISEREDDAFNSEDEMIGDKFPEHSDRYVINGPMNKLEDAYVKLIDTQSSNIEAWKIKLVKIKSKSRYIWSWKREGPNCRNSSDDFRSPSNNYRSFSNNYGFKTPNVTSNRSTSVSR